MQSALIDTAQKELADKHRIKQTHPAHFATRDFICDPTDVNAATMTNYLWTVVNARNKDAGIPSRQRLPVDFGLNGIPELSMLAGFKLRYKSAKADLDTKLSQLAILLQSPPTSENWEAVQNKYAELTIASKQLADEVNEYVKGAKVIGLYNLAMTPKTEIVAMVETICTQSMVQDITISQALEENHAYVIPRVDVLQRIQNRVTRPKPSRGNSNPRRNQGGYKGNIPCNKEKTDKGCFRYNKKGQGTAHGQCPYKHQYRPRKRNASQAHIPDLPEHPADKKAT